MPPDHVVIAGAGIVGASIGYHLAKRGARVTILEADHPGSGATGKSMGWINATFSKRPRAYFDLNHAAIAAWRSLEQDLTGDLHLEWGGSVAWVPSGPGVEQLREEVRHHQDWGYAVHMLDSAAFGRLLPMISPGDFGAACHSEHEATVDPLHALTVLLKKAADCGAEVRYPCQVTGLQCKSGRLHSVLTTDGSLEPGVFVLASGVGSARVAEMAGLEIPLKDSPGVLLHTAPSPRMIDRMVLAPGAHFKQGADGRIVAGGQIVAGAGTAATEASFDQAKEIQRLIAQYVPQWKDLTVERVTLGHRVMPLDEYPIVGFTEACANLYVAATHSGVTLAPLIGQLAALEILDGIQADSLQPYRLSRFAANYSPPADSSRSTTPRSG